MPRGKAALDRKRAMRRQARGQSQAKIEVPGHSNLEQGVTRTVGGKGGASWQKTERPRYLLRSDDEVRGKADPQGPISTNLAPPGKTNHGLRGVPNGPSMPKERFNMGRQDSSEVAVAQLLEQPEWHDGVPPLGTAQHVVFSGLVLRKTCLIDQARAARAKRRENRRKQYDSSNASSNASNYASDSEGSEEDSNAD